MAERLDSFSQLWTATSTIVAGVLWIVGILLALLAVDGQLVAVAQVLVTLSLLLTLPLFVYLPLYLLRSWRLLAWIPSLVISGTLILTLIGFVTVLSSQPYFPQPGWYTWNTFIGSFKVWGFVFMLVDAIAFWNRPTVVAALAVLTGILTYHLAGTLDGNYSDFWRLAVALVFGWAGSYWACHCAQIRRYPNPRTVCNNSGLAGSNSILALSRLMCVSIVRESRASS